MLSPEELAELDQRIGANADRLVSRVTRKLYSFSEGSAGPKPASFVNCIQPEMNDVVYEDDDSWPLWVDDAVSGVARLDWYGPREEQVPLSKKKIVQCFALLETINTSTISHLLKIERRQAARYFKACELLHEKLVDNFCDDSVRSMRYPAVFIYPREMQQITDIKEE
ncbi:hypothetical protein CNR37_00066 [Pseudomonas phage ventosus]|uniref:Uncharacterized protein n=1 Tax=Pseudomonas phage ventosus TaxID=2048980 RepID=A0A2H4P7W2_9CAUD|nr:hypothetical protein CNR37_00066 [Pseudomonas phage ventosus]